MVLVQKLLQSYWKKVEKSDKERIAALTPTAGVAEDTDIPYIDDGNRGHLADVYYPQGTSGLLPVVVDIHGGGWMYGDKELNKYYCLYLASRGFTVVNMSYRLFPETDLRGQVQDVFSCLRWLGEQGTGHHADLKKVFLTGDSAGGHLAGLTLCIQLSPELQSLYALESFPFDIKAVAISHGVNDPAAKFIGNRIIDREMRIMMAGKHFAANPLYGKINFQDTSPGLSFPPIMLISSEADSFYPHTAELKLFLDSKGIPNRTKIWTLDKGEQLGHVFHILNPQWPESQETNNEMLDFFIGAGA
jgi:acetyl esterase/lipase